MPLKNPKYIFISGGVLSSLGKGITTSSLAMLLQAKGYAVTVVKCENYLNIDSGLINPLEHGDAFLCEDGTETDMDLGNYERFLGKNLGSHNFVTMGQIYKAVIDRERENGYGGEDIEAIPHVTDEIISRIKAAAEKTRQSAWLSSAPRVSIKCFILRSQSDHEAPRARHDRPYPCLLSPTPAHVGEPKPSRLSSLSNNSMPCLSSPTSSWPAPSDLDARRRDRLALFCNMYGEDVIVNRDLPSIYQVPLEFAKQEFDKRF